MKYIPISLASALIGFLSVYCGITLCLWSFDARDWGSDVRLAFALMGLLMSILIYQLILTFGSDL